MNMKIESDELLYEYKPNDVPMRLTPNIIGFMSNIGVEGTFSVVLTCSSLCFTKKEFSLENCLNLIIKDEMFSKRIEKVISNENYQTKISNYNQIDDYLIIDENFLDKMEKNVEKILNRINLLSPKESLENLNQNQNQNQNQKPINWYAKELIYHCSNIENISLIKPNFFPWF
ncbi:transformation/transcription domain-associated protein [Anaeramoeba ignava]|uniref:Transformation/transcription domain-associated protein n=1 Tax=Anaeramoeba ignava TaxID=1746090 RepID=A0A9Q0R4N7_ANAIG|nr:transformation/transcription domain-associated protein [Anaeramoeba ignava]